MYRQSTIKAQSNTSAPISATTRNSLFSARFLRAAAVLVAGVALALITLTVTTFVGGRHHGNSALASVQARTVVAFARPVLVPSGASQITIKALATGSETSLGQPDSYTALALSPDGKTIAALARTDNGGARVHILSLDGSSDRVVSLSPDTDALFPAWSPDATTVAVVGAHVTLLRSDGFVIADAAAPSITDSVSAIQAGGGYAWSPDSATFGAIVNGALLVVDRAGSHRSLQLVGLNAGSNATAAVFLGWQSTSSLVFALPVGNGLAAYVVDAAAPTLAASRVSSTAAIPIPSGIKSTDPAGISAAMQLVPNGTLLRDKPSADSSADIFEIAPPGGGSSPPRVVIRDRLAGVSFEVNDLAPDTHGGALLDAFVQPAR